MKILSYERRTVMGALHETQVRYEGEWYPLTIWPEARHRGREAGFDVWELEATWLQPTDIQAYHRTNSGAVVVVSGSYAGPDGTSVPLS